eukprot:1085461-Amphidinium_carterae.2
MNTPRVYHEDSPSGGVKKVIGPRGRALSVGSLNKPMSPKACPKPQRTSSRSRASCQVDGARRGESLGAMPRASGLPTEFGPDSFGRSRSARRQRPDESSEVPEGGDDQKDHDFVVDVDFTEEDDIPEVIPEHKEEGFHDDERDMHLYAERTDAMEERVMVNYEEIQSTDARPKLINEPPPWWDTLLKYKPTGGITKEMCETRATWNAMEAGVRDPGYTGINLPLTYEPNPNKTRNVAHDVRRGAIIEVMNEMGHENFVAAIDDQIKTGDTSEWDDPGEEGAAPIVMEEPSFDTKMNYYVKLRLPDDIEDAVWRHTDRIAVETTGRRLQGSNSSEAQ